MITIHRYPLALGCVTSLNLPMEHKIITVQYQERRGEFSLWAVVNDDAAQHTIVRQFAIFGTGHAINVLNVDSVRPINSIVLSDGFTVFHAIEILTGTDPEPQRVARLIDGAEIGDGLQVTYTP